MAKCPPSLPFRYNRGRLHTDPEQRYMATLVENSAQGGTGVTEEKGDDETPKDWELEELLAWTNTLNFEEWDPPSQYVLTHDAVLWVKIIQCVLFGFCLYFALLPVQLHGGVEMSGMQPVLWEEHRWECSCSLLHGVCCAAICCSALGLTMLCSHLRISHLLW